MHVTLAAPATLMPFDAPHLPGALRLSQELRWPHRLEDWAFALGLSEGVVAVREEAVVGTILLTPFGPGMAAVSMVIVDRALRGRGLGRLLLRTVLERAGERWLRLTATPEGAPLYRQLGFVDGVTILQHQGVAAGFAAGEAGVAAACADDLPCIVALDAAAYGAERASLFAALAEVADFAVLRGAAGVVGFAARRRFGRGHVIGPVVAPGRAEAMALIGFLAAPLNGMFLRVDVPEPVGLGEILEGHGLARVDAGLAMTRPGRAAAWRGRAVTHALVNQALG